MARQSLSCRLIVCIIIATQSCLAHREHKVHNIVLYPDKHSWCQTQQIKQVISYPGCKSEEIDNNVCVGACFSYSIPHTEPSDPGEVIVPYCDSCQPSDTTWHHVTLQCEKNDKTPPQLVKRVQIINNCSCSSCDADHHKNRYKSNSNSDDDDDFLMGQQNDVPDVLRMLSNRNESSGATPSSSVHTEIVKTLTNHNIGTLLKNIQEKNSRHDKDQLIGLLKAVQGPEHDKNNDAKIADFVESLNSENVELDLVRLREILSKFEHSKSYEKHKKYHNHHAATVGGTINDIDDAEGRQHRHNHHLQHHLHHHSDSGHAETALPSDGARKHELLDDAAEDPKRGNLLSDNDDANSLMQQHHTDDIVIDTIINGHHHKVAGSGIVSDSSGGGGSSAAHHHAHLHPHAHHHRVGEEILGHGHLIKGPKGALVIQPDRIHEKLDVNPHELKPNHASDTLLSYSAGQMPSASSSAIGGDDVAAVIEKSSSSSRQDDNDE